MNTFDDKKRIETAFDGFAETYEDIAGKPMSIFAEMLVRDLQIPENPSVLDVGCGTGISTFELMKRIHGRGIFRGVDISQKMIDLARTRAVDLGYTDVEFSKDDAEKLDFPESSFDLAISNQSFSFFPNKQKALNEMYRVLKPEGQVGLLFFGAPALRELEDIYNQIRDRHAEYALPESLRLVGLEETHELFDNSGFKKTRIYGIHEIVYADPSKYVFWVDAPTTIWKINLPSEFPQYLAESLRKEIKAEMTRTKTTKGFKATYYNIFAYAQKT